MRYYKRKTKEEEWWSGEVYKIEDGSFFKAYYLISPLYSKSSLISKVNFNTSFERISESSFKNVEELELFKMLYPELEV